MSITPSDRAFCLWAVLVSMKFLSHSLFLILPFKCACTPVTNWNKSFPHHVSLPICQQFSRCCCLRRPLLTKYRRHFLHQLCRGHGFWSLSSLSHGPLECLLVLLTILHECSGRRSAEPSVVRPRVQPNIAIRFRELRLITSHSPSVLPALCYGQCWEPQLCYLTVRMLSVPHKCHPKQSQP